jgi:phage-related protein
VSRNQKYRKITFYKNYFLDFVSKQSIDIQNKIYWTFDVIEGLWRVLDTYFKHIVNTDGLYEIRVQVGNDIIRIFCFFETGKLVILINGFKKKTQKIPKKEIRLALKLKSEYEKQKPDDLRGT